MSNSYRKIPLESRVPGMPRKLIRDINAGVRAANELCKPQPQPQPQEQEPPPPPPAPATLRDLENSHAARVRIEAAVEKLYRKNGGARIDIQLRLVDFGMALACCCLEDELKRAQEGSTTRAANERPRISPTESRIYSDRATRLSHEREALLADARERINQVLRGWQPRDEGELQAALDAACGELTQAMRDTVSRREQEVAAAQSDVETLAQEAAALISEVKDEKDRAVVAESWREGAKEGLREALHRQPTAWLEKWRALVERINTEAGKAQPPRQ